MGGCVKVSGWVGGWVGAWWVRGMVGGWVNEVAWNGCCQVSSIIIAQQHAHPPTLQVRLQTLGLVASLSSSASLISQPVQVHSRHLALSLTCHHGQMRLQCMKMLESATLLRRKAVSCGDWQMLSTLQGCHIQCRPPSQLCCSCHKQTRNAHPTACCNDCRT